MKQFKKYRKNTKEMTNTEGQTNLDKSNLKLWG